MARPRKVIDVNLLEGLAQIGCTDTEISVLVGCSVDTLKRRFADILTKGRESLRMRLRKAQLHAAEGGNVAMLIWLGKQYLSQVDRQELEATITRKDFEVDIGGFISTQPEQDEHVN